MFSQTFPPHFGLASADPPPPHKKDKLAAAPRYARAPHNPYKLYGPFGRILLAIYTRFLVELWGRSLHNAMVSPAADVYDTAV